MNNSRQNEANDVQQWSRRRWMGAAIGSALPSLIMERDASASTTMIHKITAPVSGPIVWRPVSDPSNPGTFIPSVTGSGNLVMAIPAGATGTRTATWTATGLALGYYKVTIYYPCHVGNASDVLVQKKQTRDTSFINWKNRLNQQLGNGVTVASSKFDRTSKNVTPYVTSNAASYIWVDLNTHGEANSGSLAIRLSDGGCIGGRIVADKVVLDLMATVK